MEKTYNRFEDTLVQDNKTAARLYNIMQKWIPFADAQYNDWGKRPRCGHFFGGSYFYSVETACPMFVYSILSNYGDYDERVTGISRDEMREKAVKALRYLCFTHDLGPEDCVRELSDNVYASGTKWGGKNDQFFRASAMGRTCTMLAVCTLMLFDSLDAETLGYVGMIVENYADRWSREIPRAGTYFDTQSEENAWTSIGISSGLILFKDHPNRELWLDGLQKWGLNSVSTYKDRMNTGTYQGKSLRNYWMKGVTFHPDFTNENHSFVHPNYVAAATILRGETAVYLRMSGNDIPDSVYHNNQNIYHKAIKTWFQEDGLPVPVQGQDWWYVQYHAMHLYHGMMSLFHNEETSTYYEKVCIDFMERMQDSHKGGCLLEDKHDQKVDEYGHYSLKHMEHSCVYNIACAYLLHAYFGERHTSVDGGDISRELEGTYEFPFGCIMVNRKKDTFSSFSWRNKVMAVTLPKEGMWTVTPIVGSMTGDIVFDECSLPQSISNQSEIRDCEKRDIHILEDGFGATCRIVRGDRQLLQHVSFISLPDGKSVYSEKIEATKDCRTTTFHTGMVGIRNENIRGVGEHAKGHRQLYTELGTMRFEGYFGGEKDDIAYIPHTGYLNVDDRMGYLLYDCNQVKYINKHCYKSWRGVEDILVLNNIDAGDFKETEPVTCFSVVTLPNADHASTRGKHLSTIRYGTTNDDAAVIEMDGYLSYVNFKTTGVSMEATCPRRENIQLYEGEIFLEDQNTRRVFPVPAFRSGYLHTMGELVPDRKTGRLAIIVLNGKATVNNPTDEEAGFCINGVGYTIGGKETLQFNLKGNRYGKA
ncbi:MAG: hypothetical protein R6W96_03690 [Clostridia bacterium]